MQPRSFLPRISALLLRIAIVSAVVFEHGTADQWRHEGSSEIEFSPPHVHYDITSAELWRCSTGSISSDQMSTLRMRGHQHSLEILKHSRHWVDILTSSNPTNKLHSLGLTDCFHLTSLSNLLTTELQQNWRTLQHHNLHQSWQKITTQSTQPSGLNDSVEKNKEYQRIQATRLLKRDAENEATVEKCKDSKVCGGQSDSESDDELFAHYHNYSVMYNWYHQLAESHPDTVTLNESIGKTYYGRDILAVHFTDGRSVGEATPRRPKIYFQCLLHPREWITGSVCMYLAKYLASPGSQPKLKDLLSKVEFVMVPVANPDGYYLTWYQYPKFRLWRKNAQSFGEHSCAGVDLNRNFGVSNWNQEAESGSGDHCSELYKGPSPGSELEVKAISGFLESLNRVIGAIDFHSYHQEVLYPPASHYEVPDHLLATMDRVASSVASSASQVGVAYSSRKMVDVYSATGTFADWLLLRSLSGSQEDQCLVPLTIELRPPFDKSKGVYHGFLLPVTEILPACQEMLAAVVKFAELAYEHGRNCLSRP